jgi:hypothetical protein
MIDFYNRKSDGKTENECVSLTDATVLRYSSIKGKTTNSTPVTITKEGRINYN